MRRWHPPANACTCYFNPRTRVGCDRIFTDMMGYKQISIHAPVWGATEATLEALDDELFQSTHPCGVRQTTIVTDGSMINFNPRTRVGCDELALL